MPLNRKQVTAIKKAIVKGNKTQDEIAEDNGVTRGTISAIARGKIHTDVPWPKGSGRAVKRSGGQTKLSKGHNPTDERVLELEAEVITLRDDLNRERRKSAAHAKTRGLFKAMADELHSGITALKPPKVAQPAAKNGLITEHLVMHLSDSHADQVVSPEECGGLERFDFPIACRRAEKYIDTTLKWAKQTLGRSHHFPVLNVLAYGDYTSGEIHGAASRSYYRNQMKNSLAIGQLFALMFRDLSANFEQVNIVSVPGNHGRRTPKKDFGGAQDNWDYLCMQTARLYCRDIPNIDFLIPDAFSVNLDINGVGFHVFHGDDVKSNLGLPWYGLSRRQKSLTALDHTYDGPRIRYMVCGHFHRTGSVSEVGSELLVNGCWPACDSYSYNSFASYVEPTQLIHGVHPKYGLTWRMNVNLRDREGEKDGPTRYRIEL